MVDPSLDSIAKRLQVNYVLQVGLIFSDGKYDVTS